MTAEQAWDLETGAAVHRVSVRPSGLSRVVTWTVDGELLQERKSAEDTLVLADPTGTHGAVRLLFTALGRSRRVTWYADGEVTAHVGLGGLDLDPEPGSKAALLDAKMRAHPRRYAARHVVSGVAKVVVPILLTILLARFAVRIDWPDWSLPSIPLPSLPRPDLPDLPDLVPSIPWPDWSLPGWVAEVLEHAKYVVPVVIGIGLARNEVKRRAKQDQLKEELRARRAEEDPDRTLEG